MVIEFEDGVGFGIKIAGLEGVGVGEGFGFTTGVEVAFGVATGFGVLFGDGVETLVDLNVTVTGIVRTESGPTPF